MPITLSSGNQTLARKIGNNSQIQSINTEGVERSISLCTGDTLLYITNLDTSAPAASGLTEELGFASYKISLNTGLWERDSFLWGCKTFSHVSGAATSFGCSEFKPAESSLIYLIKKRRKKNKSKSMALPPSMPAYQVEVARAEYTSGKAHLTSPYPMQSPSIWEGLENMGS